MIGNLRRKILVRLLLAAAALAAVGGGAAYLLERRAIDQRILTLALEESSGLASHVETLLAARGDAYGQARSEFTAHVLAEHIAEGHFVVIEIYDLARKRIIEAIHPDFAAVEKVVDAEHHTDPAGDRLEHDWLTIGGVSFVHVHAPLESRGRKLASFEGIFRVDPGAMERMERELLLAVLLVVLVVFVTAAVFFPLMLRLNRDLLRLSDDLAHANMGMLAALGSAVARRDRGTGAHNYRVTIYAIHLARTMGLSHDRIRGLIKGAFLHDVGKLGIADAVLRKPGQLSVREFAVMQSHVRYGVEIVGKFEWLGDALEVVQCHHERVDGTGYPAGLKDGEIPISARIFTVVDVFDALTSRRPYKEPLSLAETMNILEVERGKSLDPDVLEAFTTLAPELHRTVSSASEPELARALDRLLVQYFSSPSGAHGFRGPPRLSPPGSAVGATDLDYLSGAWSIERPRRPEDSGPDDLVPDPVDDPFRRAESTEDPLKDPYW